VKPRLLTAAAALALSAAALAQDPPALFAPPKPPQGAQKEGRLPGFATELSEAPLPAGPQLWKPVSYREAWSALARAGMEDRQRVRWRYAASLIASGMGSDAAGVLQVMLSDDPDLALVDTFRLARGAAFAQMGRPEQALEALVGPGLAANPEACAWRMLALGEAGFGEQALGQMNCALPALNARPQPERRRFILAAASAALETRRPDLAVATLRQIRSGDPEGDLLRGRAFYALGKPGEARIQLGRVARNGNEEQRLDAEVSGIEHAVAQGGFNRSAALKKLEAIRYGWRGGGVERRALELSYRLASDAGDVRGALSAGSALTNYFELDENGPELVAALQKQLAAVLDPASKLPLDQALGLYWDFRDLAPLGSEGDLLVGRFAERLQAAGLYAKAAELLEHQLYFRAIDLARGPLSVKVGTLHILSGRPDRALAALRKTANVVYPAPMLWERHRIEAVALTQLGKTNEALALLQDVPDGHQLRAEILWKARDWRALAEVTAPALPTGGALSQVGQAAVLRHAVALAMLNRSADLATLRARYASAFARLPTAAAFDALTSDLAAVDPQKLGTAMAAIPTASPAGEVADLLEVPRKG
jgi:tetratricopeptide (TPR) repeat protein